MNKFLMQLGATGVALTSFSSCSFLKKEAAEHLDISETDTAVVLTVSASQALGKNSAGIAVHLDVNKDSIPDYVAHLVAPKSPKEQEVLDKLLKEGEEVLIKDVIKHAHKIHKVVPPQAVYVKSHPINAMAMNVNHKVNQKG